VDIVLIRFKKRNKPLLSDEEIHLWKNFIIFIFKNTSSSIGKTLKNLFPIEQQSFIFSFIQPKISPSKITIYQWVKLYKLFRKLPFKRQKVTIGYYQQLITEQNKLHKIHRTRLDKNWRYK